MPTTCQFKLSRTTPIYYSGEQITGTLILSTTKQLLIEAIQLSLVGTERVQWMEKNRCGLLSHNDSIEKDNKIVYSGRQEHVRESVTLASRVKLQPGEVCVEKFSFIIPSNAPATCELRYGELVYSVRLELQRRSVFNKVFKIPISVKNRHDLSDRTDLGQPHTLTVDRPRNSFTQLSFALACTGYVPGQSISYKISGLQWMVTCNRLCVNLCECCTFNATTPELKAKVTLKVLQCDARKISSTYNVVCGQLSIPLATHISLNSSANKLIQIHHHVEAVLLNKKRILQKFIVPIEIGTIAPKSQLTHTKDGEEAVRIYSYCYDNLANTVIGDKRAEGSYFWK